MVRELAVSVLPMKILALDQATATSGWSCWEDGQLTGFGKFSFDDEDIFKRIHKVCTQVRILVLQQKPDKIVFEDIQMQGQVNNVSTFQKLAQLQGALVETCYSLNIPFDVLRPSEWRATCNLLKGNQKTRAAQKKAAQEWVRRKFGKVCTQDEADAICIGYAADHAANNELNWE